MRNKRNIILVFFVYLLLPPADLQAGSPSKAIAGLSVAIVAEINCPGYQQNDAAIDRLKNAGVPASDIQPGGNQYDNMILGVQLMQTRVKVNKTEFCEYAFKHRYDTD